MEFIYYIFQAYATTKDVANVYDSLSEWVIETIQEWTARASKDIVDKHARKLTSISVNDVRKLANKAFAESGRTDIPRDEQETLIRLLSNLARNVQIRSAVGSMDSDLIRGGQLASLLNVVVEPVRHCGEPVTRGSGWTLTRHLGSGSFGEVWHAVNPDFPAPRAYKFFTDENAVEWLRREQAGLVAIFRRLGGHPHVVKFEDAQASQCDHPYLAFEYLGGGSLQDWILRPREVRAAIEPSEVIRELVAGLSAAHSQGIAHRDIKPANILLSDGPDVRVKIGDFGLARVGSADRDGSWQQMSYSGFAGTPLYSPPESQHQGSRRNPFQDDVFAVGIVWYQLLIGRIERPPYDFAGRLHRQGADPHTIGLIEHCLAHPDRRFANAEAVEKELREGPPPIRPPKRGEPDVQYLARDFLAALMR